MDLLSSITTFVNAAPDAHMLIFRSGWRCRFFRICRPTLDQPSPVAALTLGVTATATASSGTGQQSPRSVRFA